MEYLGFVRLRWTSPLEHMLLAHVLEPRLTVLVQDVWLVTFVKQADVRIKVVLDMLSAKSAIPI